MLGGRRLVRSIGSSAKRSLPIRAGLLIGVGLLFAAMVPEVSASSHTTITITDTLSDPNVTVEVGSAVTWVNSDSDRHRVRSISGPGQFDSGNLDPGDSFNHTFDLEGVYAYSDARDDANSAYFGTITVVPADAPPPPPGGAATVDIVDNSYRPASLSVSTGTEVAWRNLDGNHTVTARDGSFDSGIFDSGVYRRTFNSPGTFEYFCTLHPEMVGTITVTGTATGDPDPPPTTTTTVPPGPPPAGDVSIFDNGYAPGSKTVSTGTTVVWSNTGSLPHTVTDRGGAFDSGFVMASQTYRRTFNSPGTFEYFCTLHPEMVGTITVTGTATGEPDTESVEGAAPEGDTPHTGGTAMVTPSDAPSADTAAEVYDVDVIDLDYDPRDVAVGVGSTVSWTNVGELPHTVTDRAGAFDSGLMMTGDIYRRTYDEIGTFEYFCTLHPDMIGTVVVVEAGTAPPAEAPTALAAAASPAPPRVDTTAPLASAIIGLLFAFAAGLVGLLLVLARRLLASSV